MMPNIAVNLICCGRPYKPGQSQSNYCLRPNLLVLLLRVGYLERQASNITIGDL